MRIQRAVIRATILLSLTGCGGSSKDDAANAGEAGSSGSGTSDPGRAGAPAAGANTEAGAGSSSGAAASAGASSNSGAAGDAPEANAGSRAGQSSDVAAGAGGSDEAGSSGAFGGASAGAASGGAAASGGGAGGSGGYGGVPTCPTSTSGGAGGVSSAAAFDGLWTSIKSNFFDTCLGPGTQSPAFTMRLRTTNDGTLQFVELDPSNLQTEICVLSFSVTGNVATLKGDQTCLPNTAYTRTFLCDRLELEGGVLKEQGVMQWPLDSSTCTESLDYAYTPHL